MPRLPSTARSRACVCVRLGLEVWGGGLGPCCGQEGLGLEGAYSHTADVLSMLSSLTVVAVCCTAEHKQLSPPAAQFWPKELLGREHKFRGAAAERVRRQPQGGDADSPQRGGCCAGPAELRCSGRHPGKQPSACSIPLSIQPASQAETHPNQGLSGRAKMQTSVMGQLDLRLSASGMSTQPQLRLCILGGLQLSHWACRCEQQGSIPNLASGLY